MKISYHQSLKLFAGALAIFLASFYSSAVTLTDIYDFSNPSSLNPDKGTPTSENPIDINNAIFSERMTTIEFKNGGASNNPRLEYTNGKYSVRIYSNNSLTIKSGSPQRKITKITFYKYNNVNWTTNDLKKFTCKHVNPNGSGNVTVEPILEENQNQFSYKLNISTCHVYFDDGGSTTAPINTRISKIIVEYNPHIDLTEIPEEDKTDMSVAEPATEVSDGGSYALVANGMFVANGKINDKGHLATHYIDTKSTVEIPKSYMMTFEATDGGYYIKNSEGKYLKVADDGTFELSDSDSDAEVWLVENNSNGEIVISQIPDSKADGKSIIFSNLNAGFGLYNEGIVNNYLPVLYADNNQTTSIFQPEIAPDAAPAVYYNLSGIQVDISNALPGIYIRRQGSKTTKEIIIR